MNIKSKSKTFVAKDRQTKANRKRLNEKTQLRRILS